ncbi:MAG: hypothetical protein ACD_49C00009G0061 [uncultured bacterium (gcode 4)]|uniref:Uncharacterized protein n=1 Tax=uncultured bacterium (gcode 4) TaxID=1234023 RepID=K2AYL2_9BACT|nr:MAG: hypothetical protein ACD_49C00009G0061 [uncultured bacterium (gcode 4)]
MGKKAWFTLIEILIAVSISAILMTSLTIFISSAIKNSLKNEKLLQNETKNILIDNELIKLTSLQKLELIHSWSSFGWDYLTWYFLKTQAPFLPLTFVWIKSFTGYCDAFSGTTDDNWEVNKLVIKQIAYPTNFTDSSYTIDFTWNTIVTSTWLIIIWTWYPWNTLNTTSATWTELNSPFWVYFKNSENLLFITDTLNDRILIYDTGTKNINKFLWIENGISKPTNLYFTAWNKIYISSSWNWKIYEYINTTWNYLSLSGNILSIYNSWSIYPYLSWSTTHETNISDWNSVLANSPWSEEISNFPIRDFKIVENNKVLNIIYTYYKNYDCLWQSNILKEKVIKKFQK